MSNKPQESLAAIDASVLTHRLYTLSNNTVKPIMTFTDIREALDNGYTIYIRGLDPERLIAIDNVSALPMNRKRKKILMEVKDTLSIFGLGEVYQDLINCTLAA